jgi:hypothetical protein
MYNKLILGRMAFNFPMVLSFMHMVGAAIALNMYIAGCKGRLIAGATMADAPVASSKGVTPALNPGQGKSLKPVEGFSDKEAPLPQSVACPSDVDAAGYFIRQAWWLSRHGRHLIPVAGMFAASVCLRNSAFAGVPLPLMQLLTSCAPLVTYALSVVAGLNRLTISSLCCLAACVIGVAVASSGASVPFVGSALARHACGICMETCRIVVLQLLIRRVTGDRQQLSPSARPGHKLTYGGREVLKLAAQNAVHLKTAQMASHAVEQPSALTSRYSVPLSTTLLAMYSPLCAAALAVPVFIFELAPALDDAGRRSSSFWVCIFGNVLAALALNLAAVTCLQRVGVVALSLAGFIKDWALVMLSTTLFGLEVTPRFLMGMLVTTAAVSVYANLQRSLT